MTIFRLLSDMEKKSVSTSPRIKSLSQVFKNVYGHGKS